MTDKPLTIAEFASKGGIARRNALTPERRSEIARIAVAAREQKRMERKKRKATMKKRAGLLLTLIFLLGASTSRAADRRNFWLLNNTGRQIDQFYIAQHTEGVSWGNDILCSSCVVANYNATWVYFRDDSSACWYDFRLVFHDNTTQTYAQGRNICTARAIQFNASDNEVLQ